MLIVSVLALIVVRQLDAQRGEAPPRSGPVTFAINVTDAAGAPIGDVTVNLSGPVTRTTRTERGRTVFESLPTGTYKFRFEKAGYVTLEREVAGRGAKPIDVKVSLESVPVEAPPPKPVEVVPPPPPPVDVKLAVLDMLPFIEKNYIGKAAGKTTPMGCATGGSSTLLQVNEPLALHTHDDADEFIYVISGQGIARLSGREESLGPAVFLMIPRGMPHTLSAGAKKPLVMMSIRAGDKCR
jgi:mannose-6-phosphate isomerase-like protein (cupin superfamily)